MTRTVRSFLPVTGDPAALVRAFDGDPVRWLPGAGRQGHHQILMQVRAGSLSRTVAVRLGRPWHAGATCWRSLAWDPVGEDASPERRRPSEPKGEAGGLGTRTERRRPSEPNGEAGGLGTRTERLLPSLDGEFGLHVTADGRVTLILDARYRPPGGPLGRAADSIALGRVAERTVDQLLTDVAARLSAEALLAADASAPRHPPRQHRARPVRT